MNVKIILSLNLFWILTLVLHVNVYAYQRFSPKGVRACVRTHPDDNFECMLSRRCACQSYLALGQCIRNVFLCCTIRKSKSARRPPGNNYVIFCVATGVHLSGGAGPHVASCVFLSAAPDPASPSLARAAPSGGLPARPGPQAAPQRPQPEAASPRPSSLVSRSRSRGLLAGARRRPWHP